jgi:hypothetical protein
MDQGRIATASGRIDAVRRLRTAQSPSQAQPRRRVRFRAQKKVSPPTRRYKKVSLTTLQRKYVEFRIMGLNMFQSALLAGFSRAMAKNAYIKIEARPAVRLAMEAWLRKQGLDDESLSRKFRSSHGRTQR